MLAFKSQSLGRALPVNAVLLLWVFAFLFSPQSFFQGTPLPSPSSNSALKPTAPARENVHVVVAAYGETHARLAEAAIKSVIFNRRRPYNLWIHVFADSPSRSYFSKQPLFRELPKCVNVSIYEGGPLLNYTRQFLDDFNMPNPFGNYSLATAFFHEFLPERVDRFITIDADMFFMDDIWRLWEQFDLLGKGVGLEQQLPGDELYLEFLSQKPIDKGPKEPFLGLSPWFARADKPTPLHPWVKTILPGYKYRGEPPDLFVGGGNLIIANLARKHNFSALLRDSLSYAVQNWNLTKLTFADQTLLSLFAVLNPHLTHMLPCWTNGHDKHVIPNWNSTCRGQRLLNLHRSPGTGWFDNSTSWEGLWKWWKSVPVEWLDFCL